jgi:hypothetical protein
MRLTVKYGMRSDRLSEDYANPAFAVSDQVWQEKGCSLVLAEDPVAKRKQHGWRLGRSATMMVTGTKSVE